ncbi:MULTISPECIES: hypothetical protein [unclassified Haladaptatus]|uniref:hypothetical protein n=1 Tax=unclassified Haladaptatus TaxID=2622732 RepID=UPI0023E87406|nr:MULTISPECIES: hypothetical protein [unclassified Haladaptatus]
MLFDVRNTTGFEPAFSYRGLPSEKERSRELNQQIEEFLDEEYSNNERHHHNLDDEFAEYRPSYFFLDEILAIEWNEQSDLLDDEYSFLNKNKEPIGYKSRHPGGSWKDIIEEYQAELDNGNAVPAPDRQSYIQRRKLTRREVISDDWEWLIFDLLMAYGRKFGYNSVRVVVWFEG